MYSELRRCHGVDSLELKALSVPSSLRFLLGIEYDVVLCVTEVGSRRPFTLHFPVFAETFRKLLSLCAMRFSLECKHHDDGSSVLTGSAVMPLLRYADYLPGALHVEELLECLQVIPSTSPKRRAGAGSTDFEASFLDYSEFTSDASLNDVHGLGFYLTLDYGLSLASHGHLVDIRFHDDWDPKEALREFQEFSGWDTFDLRFYDDRNKREGGVIVFPTIQDVCDLLERYEDEDSDDEGDLLPFILRPVAPLVPVPSIEDSVLRKQREQNWREIVQFWERFPRTKNTVVVYNLFDAATLPDVLVFLDGLAIEKSSLVEDRSPQKRRRAFVTLRDTDSTKKALELDGKSTRGRTLRVQVAPPYISEDRRGTEVKEPIKVKAKKDSKRGSSAVAAAAAAADESASAAKATASGHGKGAGAAHDASPQGEVAARQPQQPSVGRKDGTSKDTKPKSTATDAKPDGPARPAANRKDAGASAVAAGEPSRPIIAIPRSAAAATNGASMAGPSTVVHAQPVPAPASTSSKVLGAAWATAAAHGHARPAGTTTTVTAASALPPMPAGQPLPDRCHLQVPAVSPADKSKSKDDAKDASSKCNSPSLMNAGAKEFVPSFRLNANSPEYHPEQPPSYADANASIAPFVLGGNEGFPTPPPPPPMYGAASAITPTVSYLPGPPLPRSLTGSAHLTYRDGSAMVPPVPYVMPPPYVGSATDLPPPPPPPPPY